MCWWVWLSAQCQLHRDLCVCVTISTTLPIPPIPTSFSLPPSLPLSPITGSYHQPGASENLTEINHAPRLPLPEPPVEIGRDSYSSIVNSYAGVGMNSGKNREQTDKQTDRQTDRQTHRRVEQDGDANNSNFCVMCKYKSGLTLYGQAIHLPL